MSPGVTHTRVLQVIRPAVGGMKGHMLQLAAGLEPFGFESEIACPDESGLAHDAAACGLTVHCVPIAGPLDPVRDPQAVRALRRVIREHPVHLVHAHGFKAALVARVAARLAGRPPVIVTVHNPVLYRDVSAFSLWSHMALERSLCRSTARIIAVSDALRDELVEAYGIEPSLVVTVHNGLDLSPFLRRLDRHAARERYGLADDSLVFGCAARFAPQKAMDVLVEAAVPLLARFPEARVILGGDGPLLEQVRAQARDTAVGERILFPGFIEDTAEFLSALDVFASSTLTEGLGLATIEAMAAGLPVATTWGGGTPEVVEDGITGILVEPGDADALGEAMMRLAADHALRTGMGAAGRERALAEFTEDRMFERTAQVYRDVLESRIAV